MKPELLQPPLSEPSKGGPIKVEITRSAIHSLADNITDTILDYAEKVESWNKVHGPESEKATVKATIELQTLIAATMRLRAACWPLMTWTDLEVQDRRRVAIDRFDALVKQFEETL